MKRYIVLAAIVFSTDGGQLTFANQGAGVFVQNTNLFPEPVTVVDFSLQRSGQVTGGSAEIAYEHSDRDPVLMMTTATVSISFPSYSLLNNGFWRSGRLGYIGLEGLQNLPPGATASVDFKFQGGPVSAVGAFMNYSIELPKTIPEGGETMLAALGVNGGILDVFSIPHLAPISTPGQIDAGGFRGIVRGSNDIAAVRFFNSYLVLDDLTFARIAVPEPTTILLLSVAIVFVALTRRTWKRCQEPFS